MSIYVSSNGQTRNLEWNIRIHKTTLLFKIHLSDKSENRRANNVRPSSFTIYPNNNSSRKAKGVYFRERNRSNGHHWMALCVAQRKGKRKVVEIRAFDFIDMSNVPKNRIVETSINTSSFVYFHDNWSISVKFELSPERFSFPRPRWASKGNPRYHLHNC